MPIQITDCDQGSDDWFRARMGIPTASEFSTVMAVGKGGAASTTRTTYMYKLAGEIVTGRPMTTYTNSYMERGKEWEPEARDLYALLEGVEPRQVGFIRNFGAGCSPDALVGDDGGLEIKTAEPHIQIDRLLRGTLPSDHKAQVQGAMWVTERDWWDFVSYCRDMRPLIIRVPRDDLYIATLAEAVARFNDELAALVEKIRQRAA